MTRLLTEASAPEGEHVRGVLRHHLAFISQAIVFWSLLLAAVLQLGNPTLFVFLASYVGVCVALDLLADRYPNRFTPLLGLQFGMATWPAAFVILGAAGWAGIDYHGEVVALIAVLVSGMVGMVQRLALTALWTLTAMLGMAVGVVIGGPGGPQVAIAVSGVLVGAAFGNRLRHAVEEFVDTRRRVLRDVTRVRPNDDPFSVADALLAPLVRHTRLATASLTWFTADGRSVVLGIIGSSISVYLRPGAVLPQHRNVALRQQAANGPWITGWTVREDDGGYSRSVKEMGVDAVAYMPVVHEGRAIAMLGGAMSNAAGGRVTIAEYLPVMAEMADVVASKLGPVIARLEERTSASHLVDAILAEKRFWPVFQPIRELASNRIVGYEALTRFDAPITTQRLFDHAVLVGRGRDLEVATMQAAVKAAAELPGSAWLSLNASAALLADTETLRTILEPLNRPVVLELSEREMIADYAPIARAMKRLGPKVSLAVDDAGAGFANLRHILEARPAFVKVDMGLVQGVATDPTRRALVAGFVHFANDAEFVLVAEGIERGADQEALKKLGVELGQGNLLGRPDRVSQLTAQRATAQRAAKAKTTRRRVSRPHSAS